MSKTKPVNYEQVSLEALQQGIAVIKKNNDVYGLHIDGSKELISSSDSPDYVWEDALNALKKRANNIEANNNHASSGKDVKKSTKIKIYSDGGSRGNPGPSAAGYVIMTEDGKQILHNGGKYLGVTTNNQAEYQAVKLALEAAEKFSPDEIDFCVDSLLVANQLNGIFKVKNKELWPVYRSIKEQTNRFKKVTFRHVYREDNTLADEQVNIILDKHSEDNNQAD
ncbi:MAG: ribonuclease HI family protein [Candidatus Saccharimonadales bacterium]